MTSAQLKRALDELERDAGYGTAPVIVPIPDPHQRAALARELTAAARARGLAIFVRYRGGRKPRLEAFAMIQTMEPGTLTFAGREQEEEHGKEDDREARRLPMGRRPT